MAVVAAGGVELGCMVSEGEQVFSKKLIETAPCRVELRLGLFKPALRDQHVGKPPLDLRITTRERWQEQRLRFSGLISARVNLGQMHARLHLTRQVNNFAPVTERGKIQ